MVAVHIKGFRGEVPRVSPRLLQPSQASRAHNIKLVSGRLDPLPSPLLTTSPGLAGVQTFWRFRHVDTAGDIFDNWLVWAADVDAVQSPVSNDELGRVYFSSDSFEPRMTAYAAAIASAPYPSTSYVLGVAPPSTAPSLVVTGGSGTTETRSYAYTFVTQYGEESGPGPTVQVTGYINGSWDLSALQAAPPNGGTVSAVENGAPTAGFVRVTLDSVFGLAAYEQITLSGVLGMTDLNGTFRIVSVDSATNKVVVALQTVQTYTSGGAWARVAAHNTSGMTKRIYRTAGSEGNFLFVAEIAAATTAYSDTVAGTALGEELAADTLPPPKNLKCMVTLPNGCLAGIADNELCFSEPYRPDSWPELNRYSLSSRGVALCPTGSSVIVLTDTYPVLFTGTDPEAMTPSVMETYAPCVSKRGVANLGGGCVYPSYDGLWLAVPGRVENITNALFRDAEWNALNPASFVGEFFDGQYVAAYTPSVGEPELLILHLAERDTVVFVQQQADYLLRSDYDGRLYLLEDDKIKEWEGSGYNRYAADWISGTLVVAKPTNFSCAQVHADFSEPVDPDEEQIAANEALLAAGAAAVAGDINGGELLSMEINGSNLVLTDPDQFLPTVQFTLYADGAPVFSKEVTSSRPFRLPGGYRSEVFNIGLTTTVPVHSVTVAQSMGELAQASA